MQDNFALSDLSRQVDALVPLFVIDPRLIPEGDRELPRVSFLFDCLKSLSEDLMAQGHSLIVRVGKPEDVIAEMLRDTGASFLSFGAGVTSFANKRDVDIRTHAESLGVKVIERIDDTIMDPALMKTQKGTPFRVYSPYRKAWWRKWDEACVQPLPDFRLAAPLTGLSGSGQGGSVFNQKAHAASSLPKGGERAAWERLSAFLSGPVGRYHEDRDRPDRDGTSRLSPYLRFGVISSRVCIHEALRVRSRNPDLAPGVDKWVDELIWREFYMHRAWAEPRSLKQNARPEFDLMEWNDDPKAFLAWSHGQTGYPIVDAGMRQLRETGWMHNRVRMIVASFLTKDLLIDWRKGERLFMDLLVDGDPASNSGGWQWCASTGSEAQPFFRIFNPVAQGRAHDPKGVYVKKWVPELRDLAVCDIHAPWERGVRPENYPPPMVDHGVQREGALEAYKRAQEATKFNLRAARKRTEDQMILDALGETGGNRTKAARLLGISHRALLYKIKEIELDYSG
ncbi:deoxyribodipyrimidine photo-lyase [Myxococcota bacterium]|nr:deoxyribodipyrimidine photo-lyase [Myxococcota bacterium]